MMQEYDFYDLPSKMKQRVCQYILNESIKIQVIALYTLKIQNRTNTIILKKYGYGSNATILTIKS